ncbi:MAG: hypothetical protein R3C15_19065 [Thermoleophilia bacterium]
MRRRSIRPLLGLVAAASALLAVAPVRASVPTVVGARPAEQAAVDATLRRFGAMGAVEISFATETRQGVGRGRVVGVRCTPGRTVWTTIARRWNASVLAGEIARRLRDAGVRVVGLGPANAPCGAYAVARSSPSAPFASDPPAFPSPAALRARMIERAAAAGLRLRKVEARGIDGAAVHVLVRLREEQLLDRSAHGWISTLIPEIDDDDPGNAYSALLAVESPDGRRLYAYAYEVTANAGNVGPFGGIAEAPAARPAIPALYAGATRLEITYRSFRPGYERTSQGVLDCADPARAGACDRVLRHRWEYLVPVPTDNQCTGIDGDVVSIVGTFGGIPVEARYGECSSRPLDLWRHLVDEPRSGRARAGRAAQTSAAAASSRASDSSRPSSSIDS